MDILKTLSLEKRLFVQEYLQTLDAGATVIKLNLVEDTTNAQSVSTKAFDLMRDTSIKKALSSLLEQRHLEDTGIIKSDEILRYLTRVIRGTECDDEVDILRSGFNRDVGGGFEDRINQRKQRVKIKERTHAVEVLMKYFPATDSENKLTVIVDDIVDGEIPIESDFTDESEIAKEVKRFESK